MSLSPHFTSVTFIHAMQLYVPYCSMHVEIHRNLEKLQGCRAASCAILQSDGSTDFNSKRARRLVRGGVMGVSGLRFHLVWGA